MSDWKPTLYLSFEKERTQPAIDLAARIDLAAPGRVIDIGCGPGNSTHVLRCRWPEAEIVGLDSSEAMLAQAMEKYPDMQWIQADAAGDLSGLGLFDAVFSNAAIQWMPDHPTLLKNLFGLVKDGGVLAVQVPYTEHMPIHIELQTLAASMQWRHAFAELPARYQIHAAGYYYDILAPLSPHVALWVTDYYHVMEDHAALIKWYSGTGLRPYLDCLQDESVREAFLREYEDLLKASYPPQRDGIILFPFTRIFFTLRKPDD